MEKNNSSIGRGASGIATKPDNHQPSLARVSYFHNQAFERGPLGAGEIKKPILHITSSQKHYREKE